MHVLYRKASHHVNKRFYYPLYYAGVRWKNRINRLSGQQPDHTYLFILSPPFCGSTLLNELISTSRSVSSNNTKANREGQRLPGAEALMFGTDRWRPEVDFDWPRIRTIWHKYWDLRKPVLLEKSPPNILRANSIEAHFDPAFFICFTRHPYAHCESLLRRSKTFNRPEDAAEFAIQCLYNQQHNIDTLANSLYLSYEELTDHPQRSLARIAEFLPHLEDIDLNRRFHAHNFKEEPLPIVNLNDEKLAALDADTLTRINQVLNEHPEVLDRFNYGLTNPHHPLPVNRVAG